ncbi:hypothetical protein BpHYR1_012345 [Brachionus plicatilis]|uniref:RDD domain-containing protein n=1 Tax=Brachionus plicatilis TaxID=10195 RepID=A0A3M7PM84_BRAPC|nr:hypothetical protein BpHYR1_012345 [Brachionus plicatilis]
MTTTNFEPHSEQSIPSQERKLKTKLDAELISQWYQSYYLWTSTYMLNSLLNQQNKFVPIQQNQTPLTQNAASQPRININVRIVSERPNHLIPYKIPTLTKRFIAEVIDVLYIQISKIVLAILILNYTNLIDPESYNFFDFIEDILSEESSDNIRFPVDLFLLEIIYVSISIGFEAFCLYSKGYTLGKYIMNLKVVSCNTVTELANSQFQVSPGTSLSLKSTLIRSCLKNFSIFVLFPTIIFFILPAFSEHGQTSYDKSAQSIVVEKI